MDQLRPGLYESLLTAALAERIQSLDRATEAHIEALEESEVIPFLVRHIAAEMANAARYQSTTESATLLANEVALVLERALKSAASLGSQIVTPPKVLRHVVSKELGSSVPLSPVVPLSQSALIINEDQRLSLGAFLKREIASSDRVDLICAFVGFSGVRLLLDEIQDLMRRCGSMRLITTTYLGATQSRAIDALVKCGVEVRIIYELPPVNTKLHAKAWLFHRDSGFSTATIGSSNLSQAALVDGLEWNVRISTVDLPNVIAQFRSTFERYWSDPEFELYQPGEDRDRLNRALGAGKTLTDTGRLEHFLEVRPWTHQQEILDALAVDRERHGKWKNLVVAATGTGKTIVAALDYKRLAVRWKDASILFIAHRREILQQARTAYRQVLHDGSFGELLVDGNRPSEFRHVFASIQSLNPEVLQTIPSDRFEVVVIDEFHHAEAASYKRVLEHFQPKCLLGLTATPERTDGLDVATFFGGATIEIRLWDALERGLLCPFHYFGVADNTDLRDLRWDKGAYSVEDLDSVYVTNGHARVQLIVEQIRRIVSEPESMRALGFCTSVRHAEFMAREFNEVGIESRCLSGQSTSEERDQIRMQLQKGEIRCLFVVDLFNEGVDLPEVDTVLMLRPTESATVYIQQLGRGLRLCNNKPLLTVLDFVGLQHNKFRFDLRLRAMTGMGRRDVEHQIHGGFPSLPAGCNIQLDRETTRTVLENLRRQIPNSKISLIRELKDIAARKGDLTLSGFLRETGLEPSDIYRNGRTLTDLKRAAGIDATPPGEFESIIGRGVERLIGVDDSERLEFFSRLLEPYNPGDLENMSLRHKRIAFMLAYALIPGTTFETLNASMIQIKNEVTLCRELIEVFAYLDEHATTLPVPLDGNAFGDIPISVHSFYSKNDVMAAFQLNNPASMREGVKWFDKEQTDVFFVTLRKSELDFTSTTRYDDRFISPTELHWQSQSTTTILSPTGTRYTRGGQNSSNVLLFAREHRSDLYTCLGLAYYVAHEGERPISIRWRLKTPVPAFLYPRFAAATG